MDVDWTRRPTLLEYWPDDIDVILGLDENGTSDLKPIEKTILKGENVILNESFFTLTGVLMSIDEYTKLKEKMNMIKYTYWEDGMYDFNGESRRVCFHSREIRRKDSPFNIDFYGDFLNEINSLVENINTTVFSSTIHKERLYWRHNNRFHPYHLSLHFILERYCKYLNDVNKNGIIMLESRGRKQDAFVLKHIIHVLRYGTNYHTPHHFRRIKGAYFNPKWWIADNYRSSFVILELADLISYPVHTFHRDRVRSRAFEIIEPKFYKYPFHEGWGIKLFPKN